MVYRCCLYTPACGKNIILSKVVVIWQNKMLCQQYIVNFLQSSNNYIIVVQAT